MESILGMMEYWTKELRSGAAAWSVGICLYNTLRSRYGMETFWLILRVSVTATYVVTMSIKDTDILVGSITKPIRETVDSMCGTVGKIAQVMLVAYLIYVAHWASAGMQGGLWYGIFVTLTLGEIFNIVGLVIWGRMKIMGCSSGEDKKQD
mmetsp:Transcript_87302/g.194160  ORF Transcript_87302/g.194160 Transcript_87302/m.194160 type:complete len:151 (+) Transcript_87302:142-594(+)|eukprot:CAMPEP_0180486640 /NCGR_PEP_ID=MMETSP1036_2-20121128/37100_1 /TAXON_ID=632150 /ORGANISM="Azadinium spinosum, Strain 3D9" /LENGTH=150 /DNA_ID=CAMNT_0022494601 /DNA_START=141 /DNA_END=593 /DNA_ORIENTATION=+